MILTDGPFAGLQAGGYKVITADPPWDFKTYSTKGHVKTPHAHYSCMKLADIKALPVRDLAASDCALFMWTTGPHAEQGFEVMRAWGFTYKTMGTWGKLSKTGAKRAFGTGYILRGSAEFYLVGTIGKPKVQSRSVRNYVEAPLREHSRKPDEARADFERLYDGPYVELFARERAAGWDCWGNQTDRFESAHGFVGDLSAAA